MISRLLQFPPILQNVVLGTDPALWRVRSAAGGFALVEHACHLADLEEEGFALRIERLRNESNPFLPDFAGDRIAEERRYIARDVWPAVARYTAARVMNVGRLSGIHEPEWRRQGVQERIGAVTLEQLPDAMLGHDIAHANEIVALLRQLGAPLPAELTRLADLDPLARSA
jgi:hypothetical protein